MIFNTKEKTIGEMFRFEGAEEIKISEPVLLEVVRAEKDCDCEKCYFAADFRKICQEALYGFSCKASERSDGNPVYYKFVCLDIEEQMAYTKRCYLEWLKRRNRLPEFFVKALDAVRRGENEFVAEMGRHERIIGIPNEMREKLLEIEAGYKKDMTLIADLNAKPLEYWRDLVGKLSYETYPPTWKPSELCFNFGEINFQNYAENSEKLA